MKRLEKVLIIWKDLEGSYLRAVQKDKNLSKRRYLEQLLGFNPEIDSPAQLKNMLSTEVSAYSPEEYKDYESLLDILDNTYKKLLANGEEILELDSFVYSNTVKQFDLNDYETFESVDRVTPIREALNAGHLMDYISAADSLMEHYNLGKEQPGYLAIKTENDAIQFLCRTAQSITTSFYKQIYHIVGNYIMQGKMQYPSVFLSNELFTVGAKEISIGSLSVPITKRNHVSRDTFTMTLLSKEEIVVDKLSYYQKKVKDVNVEVKAHFVEV